MIFFAKTFVGIHKICIFVEFFLQMGVLSFIDLFAGAGGVSEEFVRTGFAPLAHIE